MDINTVKTTSTSLFFGIALGGLLDYFAPDPIQISSWNDFIKTSIEIAVQVIAQVGVGSSFLLNLASRGLSVYGSDPVKTIGFGIGLYSSQPKLIYKCQSLISYIGKTLSTMSVTSIDNNPQGVVQQPPITSDFNPDTVVPVGDM